MRTSLTLVLALVTFTYAQTPAASTDQNNPQPPAQPSAVQTSNFTSAKGFVLEDGTPIKLRLNRTISSRRTLEIRWTLTLSKISV